MATQLEEHVPEEVMTKEAGKKEVGKPKEPMHFAKEVLKVDAFTAEDLIMRRAAPRAKEKEHQKVRAKEEEERQVKVVGRLDPKEDATIVE